MKETTVSMPIDEFDKLRDKHQEQERKIKELQKFKDNFRTLFTHKVIDIPSITSLQRNQVYIDVDYQLFKEMYGVPYDIELEGISFIKTRKEKADERKEC